MDEILQQSQRVLNPVERVETPEEKQKKEQQRLSDLRDIRKILDTPEGRRFFVRFFSEGRIFQTSMADGHWIHYLEGWRGLALKFFAEAKEAAPELFNEFGGMKKGGHVATASTDDTTRKD